MNRPLHEHTADELLEWLSKAHSDLLEAEKEHARAKGKFEAVQGAIMEHLKGQGKSIEVAKRLMWDDPRLLAAHEEYLEAWGEYQSTKNRKDRIDDAMRLWQTVRADARRI